VLAKIETHRPGLGPLCAQARQGDAAAGQRLATQYLQGESRLTIAETDALAYAAAGRGYGAMVCKDQHPVWQDARKRFAERLRQAMDEGGHSATSIALACGLGGRQALHVYLSGTCDPTITLTARLAAELGKDPSWLAGYVD